MTHLKTPAEVIMTDKRIEREQRTTARESAT